MVRLHSPLPHPSSGSGHPQAKTLSTLQRLFRQTIQRHRMIDRSSRVLAAVSGGPDSMALLDLLARESSRLGFSLAVAHLDHHLRSASTEDRLFVEQAAAGLSLPFFAGEKNVMALARLQKRSLEEAGRIARSLFLRATARRWGADRIAVGHQRDDLAEGILMRILQGSGSSGLAAIRPVLPLPDADKWILLVRPLLSASRQQVLEHCRLRSLAFRLDESNEDASFLRNRVRSRLIPLLEREFNPRVKEALARSAGILRDEDDMLASLVFEWMARHTPAAPEGGRVALPEKPLCGLPLALRRRVVREALVRAGGNPRKLRFDQIESLLGLIERRRRGGRVVFEGGVEGRLEYGCLVLARREEGAGDGGEAGGDVEGLPGTWMARLAVPGELVLPAGLAPVPAVGRLAGPARVVAGVVDRDRLEAPRSGAGDVAHADLDRTGASLLVRCRRPGDRFHPLGAPGSKKLGDFLIDSRVPRALRDRLPLVVSREAGQESIVWVAGLRISELFRVREETRRVLRLELRTAERLPGSGPR